MTGISEYELLKKEIEDLKKENEQLKEEKTEIKEEFEQLQENAKVFVDDLNKNKELVDIDYLKDFLESHNLLTEELKNEMDLFQKSFTVKSDIEEYVNYLNFVM